MVSDTHEQSRRQAQKRVVQAVSSVLGPAASIAHEALFVGVDLLQFAPVPALDVAGQVLLNIWDAVELIEINRLSCLRLTERCAELLLAIREEIGPANTDVAQELEDPVTRLHTAFEEISDCLQKQVRRPFWLRYVKREEVRRNISHCNALLDDALDLFGIRIQIRTLRLVQASAILHNAEASDGITSPIDGLPTALDGDSIQDTARVRRALSLHRESQDLSDLARDMMHLRQLLYDALQKADDVALMEFLQIESGRMPDAIKALQRILAQVTERGRDTLSEPLTSPPKVPKSVLGDGRAQTVNGEFIRTSIIVLRRLSQVSDLASPITPFQESGSAQSEGDGNEHQQTAVMESSDNLKNVKLSLQDPAWKVLPAALRKYKSKINNDDDDWQNYAIFISYGPPNNRIERCLSYDEKPLLLFQKLKDASKNPVFMLKHIKDIRSPITFAQQKQAARKASNASTTNPNASTTSTSSTRTGVQGHGRTLSLSRPPYLRVDAAWTSTEPPLNTGGRTATGWPELMSPAGGDSRPGVHASASNSNLSIHESAPKSAVAPVTASSAGGDGHGRDGHIGKQLEQPVGEENVGYSVAIYPYMAEQEDEFDVAAGDTFVIISRARGWWIVQRDPQGTGTVDSNPSRQGWVPAGCLLETRIPIARAIAFTSSYPSSNPASTLSSPTNGVAGGINARTPVLPLHIVSTSSPGYALMDYKKKGDEELDLSKDDALRVFKRYNHWSYAVKEDGGERGWVPSWYIAKVAASTQTPAPPAPGDSRVKSGFLGGSGGTNNLLDRRA